MTEPDLPPLALPDGALRFLYSNVVWDRHRRAVEMAIERGWLPRERSEEALGAARNGPLAAILVDRGWISESQRAEIEVELDRLDASRVESVRAPAKLPDEAARALEDPANVFARYVLIRRIGRGAMGAVWKAWDRGLNRWVAIKILHEESSPTVRERFLREARAAAKLRHPALITVYDAGEHGGRHFLSMELIEGGPLDARGPVAGVVATIRKVALALETAHRSGIIHRDLKPGNIMMDAAGEPHVVDFGLAHFGEGEASLTRTGSALGTPAYMAPEQVDNRPGQITPRTDVYALGAILYESATGRWPIPGENTGELLRNILTEEPFAPRRLNPSVPRDLETIILKALDKDPARRYSGAAALAEDLQRFMNGEPIAAMPVSAMSRMVRRGIKHRAVVLPVSAALALATAISFWAWSSRSADAGRAEAEREALRLLETARPVIADAEESLYRGDDDYDAASARVEAMRPTIEKAVAMAPRLATGRYLLGRAWDLLGWEDRAEAEWRKAVEADESFGPAYFQIARLLLMRAFACTVGTKDLVTARADLAPGYTAEAKRLLAKAAAHGSGFDAKIQMDLVQAMLAYSTADVAMVRERCTEAIAGLKGRGAEDFHWLLATADPSGSMTHLNAALAIKPKHPWALALRGSQRVKLGDMDGALADYSLALKLQPRNLALLLIRGSQYGAVAQWDRAIADYSRALELKPGDPVAWTQRGGARAMQGDLKAAIADFDEVLKLNPSHLAALDARATSNYKLGRRPEALRDYEACLRLKPDHVRALLYHGSILIEGGKIEQGRVEVEKARDLTDPSDPVHDLALRKLQTIEKPQDF